MKADDNSKSVMTNNNNNKIRDSKSEHFSIDECERSLGAIIIRNVYKLLLIIQLKGLLVKL